MNNDLPETLVISESKENTEKIKSALEKKEEFYVKLNKTGNVLTTVGKPVLIGSLLSPFDFEGPIIEIASAVTLSIGIIIKTIAKNELKEIKAIKTNGEKYQDVQDDIDEKVEKEIQEILDTISKRKSSKKK